MADSNLRALVTTPEYLSLARAWNAAVWITPGIVDALARYESLRETILAAADLGVSVPLPRLERAMGKMFETFNADLLARSLVNVADTAAIDAVAAVLDQAPLMLVNRRDAGGGLVARLTPHIYECCRVTSNLPAMSEIGWALSDIANNPNQKPPTSRVGWLQHVETWRTRIASDERKGTGETLTVRDVRDRLTRLLRRPAKHGPA